MFTVFSLAPATIFPHCPNAGNHREDANRRQIFQYPTTSTSDDHKISPFYLKYTLDSVVVKGDRWESNPLLRIHSPMSLPFGPRSPCRNQRNFCLEIGLHYLWDPSPRAQAYQSPVGQLVQIVKIPIVVFIRLHLFWLLIRYPSETVT